MSVKWLLSHNHYLNRVIEFCIYLQKKIPNKLKLIFKEIFCDEFFKNETLIKLNF